MALVIQAISVGKLLYTEVVVAAVRTQLQGHLVEPMRVPEEEIQPRQQIQSAILAAVAPVVEM
ncbi:hypothetical protein PHIN9_13130 [Polynucleobacter sp. HIN9]|nr:hypothetical protein PHIN9_13130 [Polynucleobacter sp. HIN9]